MVPYLPPKRLCLFFVLHLWFSPLLSYHLSLTLALTFLQKMEARALTRRTLTTPMMNVKMDERRKHHHFLSFEVLSKFQGIINLEKSDWKCSPWGNHRRRQGHRCAQACWQPVLPLSSGEEFHDQPIVDACPFTCKKTYGNYCVLANEPTKKWLMMMLVISLKVNWALTKVFLLLGHMATKPLGRPGQS